MNGQVNSYLLTVMHISLTVLEQQCLLLQCLSKVTGGRIGQIGLQLYRTILNQLCSIV